MFKKLKKWFTLVEILIVVVILGIVFTVMIQSYFKLQQAKTDIFIRTTLSKNTNQIIERLNLITQNYTIDYEEYFNRRIVGCNSDGWDSFSWDVGTWGYCKKFTTYGNGNSIATNTWNNVLYYCSSVSSNWNQREFPWSTNDCKWDSDDWITWMNYIYDETNAGDLKNGSGCWRSLEDWWKNKIQSFWEYTAQFWDVKENADGRFGCKNDSDDMDLWKGPIAIWDNQNVKELYLISKDKKRRILIRRKKLYEEDFNQDGTISSWEMLYWLEILKLRWFDFWTWHIGKWKYAYDGKIDTWACDKSEWFTCNWKSIDTSSYPWYKLPKDINDWWQTMTITDLNIRDMKLTIYPTKNPNLNWQTTWWQIYPYIILNLKTWFYGLNYRWKVNQSALEKYYSNIQTVFAIKPY